jgi:hypothetical protein
MAIVEGNSHFHAGDPTEIPPEDIPKLAQVEEPCEGLKVWTNPVNGFRVLRLHRSADPSKRSTEWILQSRRGMSYMDWLREVEIYWSTFQGKPVYMDEFSRHYHVSPAPLGWAPRLPVIRGWDFGLNPACIFTQLFPMQRLMVLREIIGQDIDLESFLPEVSRLSHEWFPTCNTFYDIIDPAGTFRGETNGDTCRRMLMGPPLNCRFVIPGIQAPVARRAAVVEFLQRSVKGAPGMYIDPSCDYIVRGFEAGYHYPYGRGSVLKESPDKNEFSHPHDALQYICTRILQIDMEVHHYNPSNIQEPTYGFDVDTIDQITGRSNGNRDPSWYNA